MPTSLDVAKYILVRMGPMESMKLQKLTYYSQAYNLAWRRAPLFLDPIEAWKHGPVIPELYKAHAGKVMVSAADIAGDSRELTPMDQKVVDAITESFGRLSGWQLRTRTHREDPWVNNYSGHRDKRIIPQDDMREFYSRAV